MGKKWRVEIDPRQPWTWDIIDEGGALIDSVDNATEAHGIVEMHNREVGEMCEWRNESDVDPRPAGSLSDWDELARLQKDLEELKHKFLNHKHERPHGSTGPWHHID